MRDLRGHARVPLQSQVVVTRFDVVHQLRIANASATGLFVEGDPRELPEFSVGCEVTVRMFDETQSEETDVVAMARVVRVVDGHGPVVSGIALKLTDIEDEDRERLDALIERFEDNKASA